MIQRWSHPCLPSGTSDNAELLLISSVARLSHIQPIKIWEYQCVRYVKKVGGRDGHLSTLPALKVCSG